MPRHSSYDPDDRDDRDNDAWELRRHSDIFEPIVRWPKPKFDDDVDDNEASTYLFAEAGPDPVPDWVITDDAARQRDISILKSGKEADVFLIERWLGARRNLIAAKRYCDVEDRMFRDDARIRQGRRTGNSRTDRAMARGTRRGLEFRADHWIRREFEVLTLLWSAGVAVPYPIQFLDQELMLEYLGDDTVAAPRLVHARPNAAECRDLYDQFVVAMRGMARAGIVHGDLSPFNLLVWRGQLFVIDFPQAVDHFTNPAGLDLLHHDVGTVCHWFARRGVPCDPDELYNELLSETLR